MVLKVVVIFKLRVTGTIIQCFVNPRDYFNLKHQSNSLNIPCMCHHPQSCRPSVSSVVCCLMGRVWPKLQAVMFRDNSFLKNQNQVFASVHRHWKKSSFFNFVFSTTWDENKLWHGELTSNSNKPPKHVVVFGVHLLLHCCFTHDSFTILFIIRLFCVWFSDCYALAPFRSSLLLTFQLLEYLPDWIFEILQILKSEGAIKLCSCQQLSSICWIEPPKFTDETFEASQSLT